MVSAAIISLDSSIVAAILIFLTLVFALNYLLFRPLTRVLAERERKTTGLVTQAHHNLDHYRELFSRYQATIKNARVEAYRRQEEVRSEAARQRAEAVGKARKTAEKLIQESRNAIQIQVHAAKKELDRDAKEIALGIAATILQRPA